MQTATAAETNTTNQASFLPLSQLTVGKNNPRKHFDPTELNELAESIRAQGVLQSILVRPTANDNYEIVAGERRYRAALQAYGADGYIPAVVREMTDDEAAAAALVENIQRADMSATEEAVAAGRILEKQNGNKEEAAAVLGWPVSKLNRRLALLNLTEAVMTALNERTIMVGHAELLAAAPKEKQDKALATIIAKNIPVQQVRDMLAKNATEFSKAIFDITGCANCQHNSTAQASLFTVTVDGDRCTNSDCFKQKTADRIAAIKAEVEEEFPNVRLIEVGDPVNYVAIAADGTLGVGAEQMYACKGCGNYGATVSAIPGEEGKIERGICFDATCHQKKVTERLKAEQTTNETTGTTPAKTKTAGSATTKPKTEKKKAAVSALSEKVKEYRRKSVWNVAAENELRIQVGKASSFLLDLLLTGSGSKVNSSKLANVFAELSGEKVYGAGSSKGHPEKPHALTPEAKRQLCTEAAASAVTSIEEDRVKGLLTFLDTDLGKHWTVNADFLNLLTKSEIEAVCTDIGLAATMTDFKKVIGGKKDEAVKAIMASGFDFTGKIPSMVAYAAIETAPTTEPA